MAHCGIHHGGPAPYCLSKLVVCSFPEPFRPLSHKKKHGKWGFIGQTGKVIVPPQLKHAGDFHEGRAGVKGGDKFGFIDETGKVVIPPRFLYASNFSEGLAAVEVSSGWGYIDRSGKLVWQTIIPCDRWGRPLEE